MLKSDLSISQKLHRTLSDRTQMIRSEASQLTRGRAADAQRD